MDTTVHDPLVGRLLDGRYQVGPRLAHGGMGTVYRGLDLRLDRTVALKVMHPALAADPEFVARFIREAKSAARLSHPAVVSVFDQGDDQGVVFLAMEYVEGGTLRDLLRARGGRLGVRETLDVLEQVLAALAAAHRAGIVHRDVKPENVLIGADGRIKVADFGLARAVTSTTAVTSASGLFIGTVAYLAPEQVERGISDARSDVYAAGILTYEMLTGRKPFEGDNVFHVMNQRVYDEVPPPSRLVPTLAAPLDELVGLATARDPDRRPPDAGHLLAELGRARSRLSDADLDAGPGHTSGHPVAVPTGLADPLGTTAQLPHGAVDQTAQLPHGAVDQTAQLPHGTGERGGHTARLPLPTPTPADPPAAPATVVGREPQPGGTALQPGSTAGQSASTAGQSASTAEQPGAGGLAAPAPAARTRHRGLVALIVVLLVAAGLSVAAWWAGAGPGAYTSTPSLLGLTRAQAEQRLSAVGLTVRYGPSQYSETVPAGRVLATDPRPGTEIRKDGTVRLTLSRGKERYPVPGLTGLTRAQAERTLAGTHLRLGAVTERYDMSQPAGRIIAQQPDPQTEVKRDAVVSVVLSKGPPPVEVPPVVGEKLDDARKRLAEVGLRATVVGEEFSDTVKEGRVLSAAPDSGTVLRGRTVELVVSKGPDLVAVPDVVGDPEAKAVRELKDAGFEVRLIRAPFGPGHVYSQSPTGGTAKRGSTVTVYVV